MSPTTRSLLPGLQIALAFGYVCWVLVPGHGTPASLGLWVVMLGIAVAVGELAWRRGLTGDLPWVARRAAWFALAVAAGLFALEVGVYAIAPPLEGL